MLVEEGEGRVGEQNCFPILVSSKLVNQVLDKLT